jgi:hypothetical protein
MMQIGSSTSSAYGPDTVVIRKTQAASDDTAAPDTASSADTTTSDSTADSITDTTQPLTEPASPVKSFAFGALGLDDPNAKETDTNQFYTAGKVIAAAVTVGKIISLFI